MFICYCDKCGNPIRGGICIVSLKAPVDSGFNILYENHGWNTPPKDNFDLCGACASDLWDFLIQKGEKNDNP